jgi:hypothetical protein
MNAEESRFSSIGSFSKVNIQRMFHFTASLYNKTGTIRPAVMPQTSISGI